MAGFNNVIFYPGDLIIFAGIIGNSRGLCLIISVKQLLHTCQYHILTPKLKIKIINIPKYQESKFLILIQR